ncbi:hypothetical protein RUND412_010859 [Rhizina undulata]
MRFLRKNTTIPIPEVFAFDETTNNEILAPFIMMEFAKGSSVSKVWFEDTGPTPLEERRLRILDTVASAMSQLVNFRFNEIGSLQLSGKDDDTPLDAPISIGPCIYFNVGLALCKHDSEIYMGPQFTHIGPFGDSWEYLHALLNGQMVAQYDDYKGCRKLLRIMISCLPPSKILQPLSENPE